MPLFHTQHPRDCKDGMVSPIFKDRQEQNELNCRPALVNRLLLTLL